MKERLQKIIASAGITSRRKAEDLILEGRVSLNGHIVTQMGTQADPLTDYIKVDNKLIRPKKRFTYLILNKPKNCMVTLSDPEGRLTVIDLLKGISQRVFPIGRLDWDSEGLLLLTDDGAFANIMAHPSHALQKTYEVKIDRSVSRDELYLLRNGVKIQGGKTAPCRVTVMKKKNQGTHCWLKIIISEGKNRQVRQMVEAVNHRVLKLQRVAYGPLTLQNLLRSKYRHLTPEEVAELKQFAMGKAGKSA